MCHQAPSTKKFGTRFAVALHQGVKYQCEKLHKDFSDLYITNVLVALNLQVFMLSIYYICIYGITLKKR